MVTEEIEISDPIEEIIICLAKEEALEKNSEQEMDVTDLQTEMIDVLEESIEIKINQDLDKEVKEQELTEIKRVEEEYLDLQEKYLNKTQQITRQHNKKVEL